MPSRGNSLGDLVVRLGADITGFRADMGKAARVAQKEIGSIERTVRGIDSSFRNLGRGLVAGLSVGAFASFVKSGIDAAEQLSVVSKRTGIAVEDLSVLKFAAEQSDTSFETLTAGLQKFEQNLAKAGISGSQAISMLTALADRIQQTEDPAKRLEIAVKAFGKAVGPSSCRSWRREARASRPSSRSSATWAASSPATRRTRRTSLTTSSPPSRPN